MKRIQFTSGCPNNCHYCYETTEIKTYDPIVPMDQELQILDMNFLANPNHISILKKLQFNKKKKEFVCGLDYRLLTPEICDLIKKAHFIKIRWAWDYNFSQQKTHRKVLKMFLKAGYRSEELSVFIIVNWKIPYVECCKKLDLLKVWNVKVNDCCYDGGYKLAKPIHWKPEHIKNFRAKCRKHNQLVRFKIDPEY